MTSHRPKPSPLFSDEEPKNFRLPGSEAEDAFWEAMKETVRAERQQALELQAQDEASEQQPSQNPS